MRKISKELLLIVICLIIIMLLCADIITDFFPEPHSWFNSSFAINSKVQFSQQKQPVHLPAGSQSGVGLQQQPVRTTETVVVLLIEKSSHFAL